MQQLPNAFRSPFHIVTYRCCVLIEKLSIKKSKYLYLLSSYFNIFIIKDELPSTNSNLAYSSTISIGGVEEN